MVNYFNDAEYEQLIILFKQQNFDSYMYKIFEKVKELSNGKYNVIDDTFYYTKMESIVADVYRRFKNNFLDLTDDEIIIRIKTDFISIDTILECVQERYSGFKISLK